MATDAMATLIVFRSLTVIPVIFNELVSFLRIALKAMQFSYLRENLHPFVLVERLWHQDGPAKHLKRLELSRVSILPDCGNQKCRRSSERREYPVIRNESLDYWTMNLKALLEELRGVKLAILIPILELTFYREHATMSAEWMSAPFVIP